MGLNIWILTKDQSLYKDWQGLYGWDYLYALEDKYNQFFENDGVYSCKDFNLPMAYKEWCPGCERLRSDKKIFEQFKKAWQFFSAQGLKFLVDW